MIEVNGVKLDPHKVSMIAEHFFIVDGLKFSYGGMFTKEQLEEALDKYEEEMQKQFIEACDNSVNKLKGE